MFKTLKKIIRCLSIVPLMCTSMFSHNQVTYDLNSGVVKSANINVDNGFRSFSAYISPSSRDFSIFDGYYDTGYSISASFPLDVNAYTLKEDLWQSINLNGLLWGDVGYIFYKKLYTNNTDSMMFFNLQFSVTRNSLDEIYTYNGETLYYTPEDDVDNPCPYLVYYGYEAFSGFSSDYYYFTPYMSQTLNNFNHTYLIVESGKSLYVGMSFNSFWRQDSNASVSLSFSLIPLTDWSQSFNDSIQSSVDELQSNYDTLSAQYASLLEQYNDLKSKYDSLVTSNTELQSKYDNMKDVYYPLVSKYNSLVSSYYQLYSSYSYSDWTTIFNPSSYMYIDTLNGLSSLQYQPITTAFYNSSTGSMSGSYTATPPSMLQSQSGVLWFMNNDVNPLKSLYSEAVKDRGDYSVYYSLLKCNPCVMNNENTEKMRVYITKSSYNELLDKLSYKYLIKFQDMNHTNLLDLTGSLAKTDFNIASEYIGGSVSNLGSYYYADIDVPSTSIKGIQYIASFNYLSSTHYLKLCGIGVADNSINDAYVSGFNDASSMLSSEIDELNQKYAEIENNYNNLKVVYDDYIEAYNETKIKEAYNKGYNVGRSSVSDEGASITTLFTSIVGVPITILNGLGVLTVWDIPLISVLLSLMFAMLLLWLIKKLI